MSRAESKRLIIAALKADPERSDVAIAKELGSTQPRVGRIRHELEAEGAIDVHRAKPGPVATSVIPSLAISQDDLAQVQSTILEAAKNGDLRAALFVMEKMVPRKTVPTVARPVESELPTKSSIFDELAARRAS